MAKKKNDGNNYFKLGLIILGVVLITVISANIYKNIMNNKINKSYLAEHVSSIQFNELDIAKTEFSGDTFLFISYTGDKKNFNLETKLKKIIEENELSDKVIYLDMKEEMANENYLNKLNDSLDLNVPIKKLPAIIYYKDNKFIELADSSESFFSSGNFSQLLEKYEIAD